MGWSRRSVFPLILISATPGVLSGLFVYSPAPGPGNLIASIAAAPGTDPYGNPYLGGITSYAAGANQAVQMALNQLLLNPGVTGFLSLPSVGSQTGAAGAALELASGQKNAGDAVAILTLFDAAASAAGAATAVLTRVFGAPATAALLEVQGSEVAKGGVWALAGTASGSPPTGAEVWNDLGSTGLAGDAGSASYRFTAEGELQLSIHKSFTALGGITSATFATVLPGAYIPPAGRLTGGDPIALNGAAPGSGTRLTITGGTGAVNLVNLPAGATAAGCDVRIPLI